MTPELSNEQLAQMAQAIDNNMQDSPAISIDPKSNNVSVVGDPNNLHPTNGDYTIVYEYMPEEISATDQSMLDYDPERKIYTGTLHYKNKRVKPLYRTKVSSILLTILTDIGVLTEEGYSAKMLQAHVGDVFINHTEDILELASLVLGERKERLEHARELFIFLVQLIENEPNIINETSNFLESMQKTSTEPVAQTQN